MITIEGKKTKYSRIGDSISNNKKIGKILFVMQLPPPMHGSNFMNSLVASSKVLKNHFDTHVIKLQFAKSVDQLGRFSLTKVVRSVKYGFKIWQTAKMQKPDLTYLPLTPVGFGFYRDALYIFLLKRLNQKIVLHLHGTGIRKNSENSSVKNWLYKKVFDNTRVICLSRRLINDYSHIYSGNSYIVPNGIAPTSVPFSYDRKEVPHILYLSNFVRAKGSLVLLKALNILKRDGYGFKARLIGAPFDLKIEDVKKEVEVHGLTDRVEVTGPAYGKEKLNEFSNADIFVFPPYENEAFGLVNLEAMQCGLPVVGTNLGGIPDIVQDQKTGFIVEPRDAKALADKLKILIDNPDVRTKMGECGYARFINHYTIDHFEENLTNSLVKILKDIQSP